jgi:acyl-CoA thioester hydrolase
MIKAALRHPASSNITDDFRPSRFTASITSPSSVERSREIHSMTSTVLQVRVPPRHCDSQGMMHAVRPYEYFEDAFLAWLDRECGGYESLRAGGDDFVIVQSQCRYIAPARLGDRIDLSVRPVSVGERSSFTVEIEMARDAQVLTRGSVTYVTVRDGRSSQIPGPLRQAMRTNEQEM